MGEAFAGKDDHDGDACTGSKQTQGMFVDGVAPRRRHTEAPSRRR